MEDTLGSQKQRGVCMNEPLRQESFLKDRLSCRISEGQLGSGCYGSSHWERASLITGDTERAERIEIFSVLAGR